MANDVVGRGKSGGIVPGPVQKPWRRRLSDLIGGTASAFDDGATALVSAGDEDIKLRAAMQRLRDQMLRDQENLEQVVSKAEASLHASPPPEGSEPTADFMHRFQKAATNATLEEARELFAQALAGEFRAPGTFSFAALDVLSSLDAKLAASVEFMRPFIALHNGTAGCWPALRADAYRHLTRLQARGLMVSDRSTITLKKENGAFYLVLDHLHQIRIDSDVEAATIETFLLTEVGREIFSLVEAPFDSQIIDQALEEIRSRGQAKKVELIELPFAGSPVGRPTTLYDATA